MRIVTWNVNGLRSGILSCKKWGKSTCYTELEVGSSIHTLITTYNPDIICLQEIKCDDTCTRNIQIPGYYIFWNPSRGEGVRTGNRYSGTALLTKVLPQAMSLYLPTLAEEKEGRAIVADFGSFVLINTYVPNSGSNYDYRINTWNPAVERYLHHLQGEGRMVVWTGDLNVVAGELDVLYTDRASSSYQPSAFTHPTMPGLLLEERAAFQRVLELGMVDIFRHQHPETRSYTWFNPRIPAHRTSDRGWRLDYFLVDRAHLERVGTCQHLRAIAGSDHIPVMLDLTP